jgi:LysR family hydrogen peroxide-inducible transcriptional activator
MDWPSLRQLECFQAVAERLSFRRAAERCSITQPALSQQIQQLERLLGARLFERDRRRVLLTPAGEELLPRARAALRAVDELVQAADAARDPLAGPLRLGVIPTVAPYVLPAAVGALRRRCPDLRLYLREDRTSRLVERVQDGRLDLALLALEADLGTLERMPLYRDPFVLAVPAGHALSRRAAVGEQDLVGLEVLLLEDGHCLRDQALALCERVGARELGDFRATSLNTLARMVAAGTGVTLLPAMALPVEVRPKERIVTVPFERQPARTIGLVWRPTTPRRSTFELLGQVLAEQAPPGAVPLKR